MVTAAVVAMMVTAAVVAMMVTTAVVATTAVVGQGNSTGEAKSKSREGQEFHHHGL
jgi:hypothetical protein